MKCESCNLLKKEVDEYVDEAQMPYCLCRPCQQRLFDYALRPLEFFNLAAIHGHTHLLHDDFYDFDTGEARQPKTTVIDAEEYPFPQVDDIKNNAKKLVDYACVQYFTSDEIINLLKLHNQKVILKYLDDKTAYNRSINYKTYEIAANVLGLTANKWIIKQWENRKENEVLIFAEAICKCVPFSEAFVILTTEIALSDGKRFVDNSAALLFFEHEKTLDWMEQVSSRITNVSRNWGTLAAASQFTWNRAEKWLLLGRPLSLIALDAIAYCTTKHVLHDQALWFIRKPPMLLNLPTPEVIIKQINTYLHTDKVPRTKNAVAKITQNLAATD